MKLFQCQKCGQLLHFENTSCGRCGSPLGYLPQRETMTALAVGRESRHAPETIWRALVDQQDYRLCANSTQYAVCNWRFPRRAPILIAVRAATTETDPGPVADPQYVIDAGVASRSPSVACSTRSLRLPSPLLPRSADPDGLAFDFLSRPLPHPIGSRY